MANNTTTDLINIDPSKYPETIEIVGSKHKTDIKDIIKNSLAYLGVPADYISNASPAVIMTRALSTKFDYDSTAINNQKIEASLLYCRKNSSLYNQLAQANGEIILAKPSSLNLYVQIPYSDLMTYGTSLGDNLWEFTLTQDNIISLDEAEFIPTVELIIRIQKNVDDYILRIFKKNDVLTTTDIVPQEQIDEFGNKYVLFVCNFIQLKKSTQEFSFMDSQLESFILRTKDAISSFSIKYSPPPPNQDLIRDIEAKLYLAVNSKEYIQYKILEKNMISLDYKYVPKGFKADIMGKLYIDVKETTGRNIKYKGSAVVIQSSPKNLNIQYVAYDGYGAPFVSTGGVITTDNKEELRTDIISLKGSRRRIDTEEDLNLFLSSYTGSSKFKSKKIINNTQTRLFTVNTILAFKSGSYTFITPTDCGDVSVLFTDLPEKTFNGNPHVAFSNENIVVSTQTSESPDYLYEYKPGDIDYINNVNLNKFYYNIPFNMSYDKTNNFLRVYADTQYDVAYPTKTTFNAPYTSSIFTRFVNTTLRMNDYLTYDNVEKINKRVFKITTQIRSNNITVGLDSNNFKAILYMKDTNESDCLLKCNLLPTIGDSIYDIEIPISSDRNIFGQEFTLTYTDATTNESKTRVMNVTQNTAYISFYTRLEDLENPGTYGSWVEVSKHSCNTFAFFKDVTAYTAIQTTMDANATTVKFKLAPLISSSFYKEVPENRITINNELDNIYKFFETKLYDKSGLDQYSSDGYTMKELQETLFTAAIKFIKSSGRSRTYEIYGGSIQEPVTSLQIRPSWNIRKINYQYDTNKISTYTNNIISLHDYVYDDLSIDDVEANIKLLTSSEINRLQFICFDKTNESLYNLKSHIIRRNNFIMRNFDTPEILSIEPIYNRDLGLYVYNTEFIDF